MLCQTKVIQCKLLLPLLGTVLPCFEIAMLLANQKIFSRMLVIRPRLLRFLCFQNGGQESCVVDSSSHSNQANFQFSGYCDEVKSFRLEKTTTFLVFFVFRFMLLKSVCFFTIKCEMIVLYDFV